VPDLAARHAYISGPPGLIADLAPALEKARSITTDAFRGIDRAAPAFRADEVAQTSGSGPVSPACTPPLQVAWSVRV
jgi:hypothetical protein